MTERWEEYSEAYNELGSIRAVAKQFGVNESSVRRSLKRAADRGHGLTPYTNPPGFRTGKVTVQCAADGSIEKEWRRISPEAEDIEAWVNDLCERVRQSSTKIKPPKMSGDTMTEIPIGDLHAGMYAWAKETGIDWDTEHACRIFTRGVRYLIDQSPKGCQQLVLADLGDFLHADNRYGVTEKSGNVLDMDTRFTKVIDMARDAWVEAIEYAAERFPSVRVIMTPGNHNPHSAYWMARIIEAKFDKSDHVDICTQATTHRYHRWEKVLLAYAHGHLIKANALASVMATEAKQDWAATDHHHWRCGHIHHSVRETYRDRDESDGVTVEYFPTLAGRDSYHAERGYLSRRMMQGIIHHAEHGEIARHTVHARMIA